MPMNKKISRFFAASQKRASEIVRDRPKLDELLRTSASMIERIPLLGRFSGDFRVLLRLLKAWMEGRYDRIPWKSCLAALGALVYLVNPFDAVPDFIPFYGALDDAVVFGFVLKTLRRDLAEFRDWELASRVGESGAAQPLTRTKES